MVHLTIVKNEEKYWEFIRNLRNMNGVRQGFVRQDHIGEEHQKNYMSECGKYFYICLVDGDPAGYVGVIEDDIRVATHPDFQGMGVGSFMISEIHKLYPTAQAKVKINNIASFSLFIKNGYKVQYYILEKK